MGFMSPSPPPFEIEEWRQRPYRERLKPLAQDWAVNGIGVPQAVYLLYIVKLIVFAGGGLLLISATSDLGGLSKIGDWWTEPVVFQNTTFALPVAGSTRFVPVTVIVNVVLRSPECCERAVICGAASGATSSSCCRGAACAPSKGLTIDTATMARAASIARLVIINNPPGN